MIHGTPIISHKGNYNYPQAQKELLINFPDLYIDSNDKDYIIDKYKELMIKFRDNKEYKNDISKLIKHDAMNRFNYLDNTKKYIELFNNICQNIKK